MMRFSAWAWEVEDIIHTKLGDAFLDRIALDLSLYGSTVYELDTP